MKKIISLIILSVLCGAPILEAQDARKIMKAVLDRDDGETEVGRVTLSTCPVKKEGNRFVCTSSPRIKVMDVVRKDFGPNKKDKKTVSIIRSPAGEKGIGFLQYDWDKKGKETDQWLYLSALGKVKRIVSGNENEPKTGSFFGSELSYEDMEERHLDDYTYRVLGHEPFAKKECTVIESVPIRERAVKSNYAKSYDWVDESRQIVLKSLLFDRRGKKIKRIYFGDIKTINGILVPTAIVVFNLQTGRRTRFVYDQIHLNVPVPNDFLTQRTLVDGAFRQTGLNRLKQGR